MDDRISINGRDYYVQNCGRPHCFQQQPSGVLRFEVKSGDQWAGDKAGKERSEVAGVDSFPYRALIKFEFAVEASLLPNSALWLCIGQWRQSQLAPAGSPPFSIELAGEEFRVVVRTRPDDFQKLYTDPAFKRDRWYALKIEAVFDENDGSLDIAKDGFTIVQYRGPLGFFPEPRGGYWKSGIYRSAATETFVLRVRGLSVS